MYPAYVAPLIDTARDREVEEIAAALAGAGALERRRLAHLVHADLWGPGHGQPPAAEYRPRQACHQVGEQPVASARADPVAKQHRQRDLVRAELGRDDQQQGNAGGGGRAEGVRSPAACCLSWSVIGLSVIGLPGRRVAVMAGPLLPRDAPGSRCSQAGGEFDGAYAFRARREAAQAADRRWRR